jgi:hypothetical protein
MRNNIRLSKSPFLADDINDDESSVLLEYFGQPNASSSVSADSQILMKGKNIDLSFDSIKAFKKLDAKIRKT